MGVGIGNNGKRTQGNGKLKKKKKKKKGRVGDMIWKEVGAGMERKLREGRKVAVIRSNKSSHLHFEKNIFILHH